MEEFQVIIGKPKIVEVTPAIQIKMDQIADLLKKKK